MIYFDNAATTPMTNKVIDVLSKCSRDFFGNPSTHYSIGVKAKRLLEQSRKDIANCINCESENIIFTAGGTESNNIALQGLLNSAPKDAEIIVNDMEHSSVLNVVNSYSNLKIIHLKPSKHGVIDVNSFKKLLNKNTYLVAVQFINNELGTIQPIEEISEAIKDRNIYFHVDAVQALGHIQIDVKKLNITSLSASAHKFNGPKGIGFLYSKSKNVKLCFGGEQENGIRPGTENVPSIVAMSEALKESLCSIKEKQRHITEMITYLETQLLMIEKVHLNIELPTFHSIISFRIENISNESLINLLDLKGICISAGSACDGKNFQKSHVLKAIELPDKQINETLRLSLSYLNTIDECRIFIEELKQCIKLLKQ